ncbi:hypothetical protein ACFTSF_10985 [Kribbella sp. NPDC056951]|uniref:hypothetical protein n=1 Tax=Kribbella sp. NPDC056951 TaxID=3345978 RepID=UPI003636DCE0
MSSSRDTDAFLASLDYGSNWENAEAYIAKKLHLELNESEHLGDDWVLTPDEAILAGCQQLIDSTSEPVVREVLVAALRTSYHLRRVHSLLAQIAETAAAKWRAGDREVPQRNLLRRVSQAYHYGVVDADLDFVLRMCAEPTFAPQSPEDGEDLRGYWFESLAKLKDAEVGRFCRNVIDDDLGRWTDFRLIDAMRVAAKSWTPSDAEVFSRIAAEHSDSWIRQNAKRILKRHV